MHDIVEVIPDRITDAAVTALEQANQNVVDSESFSKNFDQISILNAARAGELFLKAIIAYEHPLLIFENLYNLEDRDNSDSGIKHIISKGRTYGFDKLPKLLWVVTGERIPDQKCYDRVKDVRNSIQHFCAPEGENLIKLTLEFIYKNIDPLIRKHLDKYAIEYIGNSKQEHKKFVPDLVSQLISNELLFSIPKNFKMENFDFEERLSKTKKSYQTELRKRMTSQRKT